MNLETLGGEDREWLRNLEFSYQTVKKEEGRMLTAVSKNSGMVWAPDLA
jgi:hypothetical protein